MKYFYKTILIAFVLFSFGNTANASHISGTDITYQCVGQDSFLVTLNLFRDCSGIQAPVNTMITFTNSCGNSFNQNLILQNSGGTEVSQLCSSQLVNSSCNGGSLPGFQHFIYSTVVVLSSPCNDWTLSWASCCRNISVNLVNGTAQGNYLETTIANSSSCNNSPVFSENFIRYVCINQAVSHAFTVTEADGDSIVYHMKEPFSSYNVPAAYAAGYTYLQPIPGIALDTATGLVTFTPILLGAFVLAVEVCEYEYGTGILKGCITRDIEYIVLNCTNQNVEADSTITNFAGDGTLLSPFEIEVCAGDSLSFDVIFTDSDTGDNITDTSNILSVLPGATITSTGGNPDTASITWVVPSNTPPINVFVLNAVDDACPVNSSISKPIKINVINSLYAGVDQTICLGTQWVSFPTVGGSVFSWSVISGSPIDTNSASPNYNMTCTNCQYPQVSPQVTTTYEVTSNLTGSCSSIDTVTVFVVPDFTLTMPNDTLICSVDEFQLNTFTNQPFSYDYQWSPAYLLDNDTISNPVTNPVEPTTYTVTVTSSAGCAKSNDIFIDLSAPFPLNNQIIGDTVLCSGTSTQLGISFGQINYAGCDTSSQGCNGVNQNGLSGTGTSTAVSAMFTGSSWGSRNQILYRASELNQMGLQGGGYINSISFYITSIAANANFSDFQIKMGCVSTPDLSSGWNNSYNMSVVSSFLSYSTVIGWNTFTFNTPYQWDGQSNIVIETCFNNYSTPVPNFTCSMTYTSTNYQSIIYAEGNDSTVCSSYPPVGGGAIVTNTRPNTRFNFCTGINTNSLTYSWTPSIGLSGTNIENPIANPLNSINYQVIVTGMQGICTDTLHHSVDVVSQFDAGFFTQSPYCINGSLDTLLPLVGNGVFTGNAINSLGVFDPTLAGIGIWPINYSISSPAACANDSTINVEVLSLPDASIQYQEVCFGGNPITLVAITTGGIFSGLGITDSINGVFDPIGLTPGTYNITYTLSQPCLVSEVTGIKVIEPYNFYFNQSVMEVCQDDSIDLSINYTLSSDPNQGSGPVKAYWSNNNGYVDSNGVFSAVGVPQGDYIVELNVTDSLGGCGSVKTMIVRVLSINYPEFPAGLTFCETDGQVIIEVVPWLFGTGTTFTQTPIAPLGPNDLLQITQFGSNGRINTTISGTGSWGFMVSYTNLNGCTGVTTDTIYVLPAPVNDSIIQNQTVLTAVLGGGYDYQWLDCSNNMAPVPGATNQSFTPAVTGDYAVVISAGNCSITSGCYYGWSVGVEQVDNELGISIFPNPTHDAFQIDRGNNKKVEIQIIDFTGKEIWKQSLQNPITTIDLSSYANGVYIIKMSSEKGSSTQKIIKQ